MQSNTTLSKSVRYEAFSKLSIDLNKATSLSEIGKILQSNLRFVLNYPRIHFITHLHGATLELLLTDNTFHIQTKKDSLFEENPYLFNVTQPTLLKVANNKALKTCSEHLILPNIATEVLLYPNIKADDKKLFALITKQTHHNFTLLDLRMTRLLTSILKTKLDNLLLLELMQHKSKQLADTLQFKTQFLDTMSMNLKHPLDTIHILSHMMMTNEQNNLTVEQEEATTQIHQACNSLQTLIQQILNLQRSDAKQIQVSIRAYKIRDEFKKTRAQYEHLFEDKNLKFSLLISPIVPDYIHTDIERLNVIIKHLLFHALEFTQEGSVKLSLDLITTQTNTPTLELKVEDTGSNLSDIEILSLFETFDPSHINTQNLTNKTGIGLITCKRLIDHLKGELHITSHVDKGSSICVHLPLETL